MMETLSTQDQQGLFRIICLANAEEGTVLGKLEKRGIKTLLEYNFYLLTKLNEAEAKNKVYESLKKS